MSDSDADEPFAAEYAALVEHVASTGMRPWPRETIAELMTSRQPSNIPVSADLWAHLASGGRVRAFLDPDTIRKLAAALGVPNMRVVDALAVSIGLHE